MEFLNPWELLLKQHYADNYDPISLKHRELILQAVVERMEGPITADEVRPLVPWIRNDDQAKGLFFLCAIGQILALECGHDLPPGSMEQLQYHAFRINTPEMTPETLANLVLERMSGSATYRPLH